MKKFFPMLALSFLVISACGGEQPKQDATSPVKKEASTEKAPAVEETPAVEMTPAPIVNKETVKMEAPKVLKKCRPCHSFKKKGKKKVGPNLFGIYGAEAGKVAGFKYSSNFMKAFKGKKWNDAMIDAWIKDPKALAGKTKMITKISNANDRMEIIDYLKALK